MPIEKSGKKEANCETCEACSENGVPLNEANASRVLFLDL